MRALLITIIVFTPTYGSSQDSYQKRLSNTLDRIKEMPYFDNNVIMLADTIDFHMSFPYWKSFDNYYEGDVVRFKYCQYEAKKETKGKVPDVSLDDWRLIRGPHPYLFLRDTAKVEDLKTLLYSDNPYIRTYSFVVLSGRKYEGLYQVVRHNLKDTAKVLEVSSDMEFEVYPAEIMMRWGMTRFTKNQKRKIKKLILSDYHHLKGCINQAYW